MKCIQVLLYLMGVFSTMYIVRIAGIPVSTLLAILCIAAIVIFRAKAVFLNEKWFLLFLCSTAVTTVLSLLRDTTNMKTQLITFVVMFILYLCSVQMRMLPDSSLYSFFSGLRMSCIIHLGWCVLQWAAYEFAGLDINQMVFADMLHMTTQASCYREGVLAVTGFCWHPSNLVPVLLLSSLLLNRWYIWALSFFIVIYAHSGTALLGLLVAFFLVLPLHWPKIKAAIKKIRISTICIFLAVVVAVIGVMMKTNLFSMLLEKYNELYGRVFQSTDVSSQVHMRYYTMVPFVWSKSSLMEILFGCGLGCSGVLFSRYFNQYTSLSAWVVESDPMNYLYSVGLVGFLLFYAWMVYLIRLSLKSNRRYLLLLICLLFCGITYNVQYEWVIMTELVMAICMERNIDIFQSDSLLFQKKPAMPHWIRFKQKER